MKYKLINSVTKIETICEKVTIDGFDYYVSDAYGKPAIATNNPNIDIPKVVDELMYKWELGLKVANKSKTKNKSAMRNGYVKGYNKSQETHPNSDDDMIEFWIESHKIIMTQPSKSFTPEELLQIWKEQKPKIVYYE